MLQSSSSSTATATPPLQALRGFGGPGLVGVRVEVVRMQAAPPPPPPSPTYSVSSMVLSSLPIAQSPATAQLAGEGAAGQGRECVVAARTGGGAGAARRRRGSGQRQWRRRELAGRWQKGEAPGNGSAGETVQPGGG